ncbi:MAG TPA: 7-carboxy-7-deazaguanine synthase QueE [Gammaproteobacteria bacterium]|nr:7-carboxy-7-deazaguanine synthase QueE [Gammaproteobacteria bacterium]
MLRITETFLSIQGESGTIGLPTVFVRLTGCPLRCKYCDTAYAFNGGEKMSVDSVVEAVLRFAVNRVTVTGGEPLAQPECLLLLRVLCDQGFAVSIETSGALSIDEIDPRVTTVMDLKTPSSGEQHRNLYENLAYLDNDDEIKFVVSNRADYDWAKATISKYQLLDGVHLLMSPNHEVLHPRVLAEWILEDRLPVRLQVQLHKYLWGNEPGH